MLVTLCLLCSIIDSKNSADDNAKSEYIWVVKQPTPRFVEFFNILTILNTTGNQKSLGSYLLKSFSVVQNYKNLTHSTAAGKYSAQVDFIKIFNMVCVVQAHRYIFSEGYPKFPVERIEKVIRFIHLINFGETLNLNTQYSWRENIYFTCRNVYYPSNLFS